MRIGTQAALRVEVWREDQHCLGRAGDQPADRLRQGLAAPVAAVVEDIPPALVLQTEMDMHAVAGEFTEWLGHETGHQAVPAGNRADRPP